MYSKVRPFLGRGLSVRKWILPLSTAICYPPPPPPWGGGVASALLVLFCFSTDHINFKDKDWRLLKLGKVFNPLSFIASLAFITLLYILLPVVLTWLNYSNVFSIGLQWHTVKCVFSFCFLILQLMHAVIIIPHGLIILHLEEKHVLLITFSFTIGLYCSFPTILPFIIFPLHLSVSHDLINPLSSSETGMYMYV